MDATQRELVRRFEDRAAARGDLLDAVRPATRAELLRRVDRATDFLLSEYTQPFSLDAVAAAAHLSKYHLVRLFRAFTGLPPGQSLRSSEIKIAAISAPFRSGKFHSPAAIIPKCGDVNPWPIAPRVI